MLPTTPATQGSRLLSPLLLLLLLPGSVLILHISAEIIQVTGVVGGTAELPCDLGTDADDEVTLVLWYRNDTGTPIYSLDFRSSGPSLDTASHNPSDALANRAFFRVLQPHAYLQLEGVRERDEGLYRCRVDFRRRPTRNHKINLTVIVPPGGAVIIDEAGQTVTSPWIVHEDAKLILSCEVSGGRPTPRVSWWKGTRLLESTSEENAIHQRVRSDLIINRLTRADVNTNLTCQASNTNLTIPISKTITLDLSLRPLDVRILGSRDPLSSGKRREISCRSSGSRPQPTITWHKNNRKLKHSKDRVSSDGNTTVSTLSFFPTREDNGKFLTCRVENSRMPGTVLEDSWKLDVYYPPQATLGLGSSLKKDNLKEGDDVYFECTIQANPRAYRVDWKFEGQFLNHNISAGIITSNQSLVLQKVRRTSAGHYTCIANNVEGDGESNSVHLQVKHVPVCRMGLKHLYGVARHETVNIVCEVSAIPHQVGFRWGFNNSVQVLDLPQDTITSGGLRSMAVYTPHTDSDYGVLYCWAHNEIGEQREPCTFTISVAGPPDTVHNCTIQNQTEDALHVECSEGFDGGMIQSFIMEVYDTASHQLKSNITSVTPVFQVNGLQPGTGFMISVYAFNAKGRSESLALSASTLHVAERRTESPAIFTITPILGVLIGVVAALVLVAIIIVIVMRFRAPDEDKKPDVDGDTIDKSHIVIKKEPEEFDSSDEKNPDVVPNEDDAVYADVEDKVDYKLNNVNARIYENIPNAGTNMNENMYENVNNIKNQHERSKPIKHDDNITYAELQLPNSLGCNTIRGGTQPTVYAQIDHSRKAPPNVEGEEEDQVPTVETPLMNGHRESTVQGYGTGELTDVATSLTSSSSTRF